MSTSEAKATRLKPPATTTRRLVVLGDSLAAFRPDGKFRPDDSDNFPHQLRAGLEVWTSELWDLDVVAQTWWSVSAAAAEVLKPSELRERLAGADAVVIAIGTADCLPICPGTRRILRGPTTLQEHNPILRFIRPRRLKNWIWRVFSALQLTVVRRTHGRFPYTPLSEFRRRWPQLIEEIRAIAPTAWLCASLPTEGREGAFVWPSPHRDRYASEIERMAADLSIPTVDFGVVVKPFLAELPDGTHWHAPVHRAAALTILRALVESTRRGLNAAGGMGIGSE